MQTTEEKVDTSKALDASLVDTECSRIESKEHDTSSRSGNDAHDDGVDIRPIDDEEPMVTVQTTAEINVFSIGQQHTEQPEFNNEGEVNSRAKVPSNKTANRNKPVEQITVAKKPKRQIPKGHRFSIQKTSIVQKKTMTPRSCLRWKPTGRIFKTLGLRWIPTGKIFASSTTKVDSEPLNVKFKAGSKVVPPADKTATSRQELEFLPPSHNNAKVVTPPRLEEMGFKPMHDAIFLYVDLANQCLKPLCYPPMIRSDSPFETDFSD
nr:hypothetical protein [Tanacetum cinerariifolium]